ncbi:glycosyltransferase, partial [Brachybacterium alimentarium]|uniref:glycosyltransferase n=1 Tax=Brachybacterium alimentarium TaxID=47845 RepID=UPI003FD1CFBD
MLASHKASIIIPTYNRTDELALTLAALERQKGEDDFDVVVADDGSDRDIRAVTRRFGALKCEVVRHERDGFRLAATRNLGAKHAVGDLLIFLDSGTLPGPLFVDEHVRAHARNAEECAVMGSTFGYDVGPYFAGYIRDAFTNAGAGFDPSSYFGVPGVQDYRVAAFDAARGREVAMPWRLFWGRNISVLRSSFETAGCFDEAFRSYGVEDIELGYRLYRAGLDLVWVPDAWALEIPEVSDLSTEERVEQNQLNLGYMQRKHNDCEIEFFRCIRPSPRSEQVEWEALQRVLAKLGDRLSAAEGNEVSEGSKDAQRPRRVYFGLPASAALPGDVVLDPAFQQTDFAVGASTATSAERIPSLGMLTGFADKAFEEAVIRLFSAECGRAGGAG